MIIQPMVSMVFDGHGPYWTNGAIVSMDRSRLNRTNSIAIIDNGLVCIDVFEKKMTVTRKKET